jgi:hypothetical protein
MIDIRSEEFSLKPKFHNRIDRSDLQDVFPKPLEASNAFLDNPILKLLGWNLPIFSEPPLIPPVVRKKS